LKNKYYAPGGFGGAGGVPPFFLNILNGFGGGGGPPAGAPPGAGGPACGPAGAFLPFLKGFILFRSLPALLNTWSGGGGDGGPLCAITDADTCVNPKVNAPARIYLVILFKLLFFCEDCIAAMFLRLANTTITIF
jgi:hypothetical protein